MFFKKCILTTGYIFAKLLPRNLKPNTKDINIIRYVLFMAEEPFTENLIQLLAKSYIRVLYNFCKIFVQSIIERDIIFRVKPTVHKASLTHEGVIPSVMNKTYLIRSLIQISW